MAVEIFCGETGEEKNDRNRYKANTPVALGSYDLKEDPNETRNISGEIKNSVLVQELKSMMVSVSNQIGDTEEAHSPIKAIIDNNWEK